MNLIHPLQGEPSDAALIHRILRRGSRTAADALVRCYYDEIYRFVYRQTGSKEDALDLTQECFLAALRALPTYNGEKAGFRTWLYRIAVNKVIDARRRNRAALLPLEEQELVEPDDFAARVADADLLRHIEDAVRAEPPDVQQVYRLKLYAGATFAEIAAALGQSEAKTRSQYYRLMQRLRKEFDRYG